MSRFVAVVCGAVALVGPLYLKTSIHLRMPYAGTSYFALYSVLDYTEIGRSLGGGRLPEGVELSEREATKLLQERVGRGLRIGLSRPWQVAKSGFLEYSRFIHGVAGTAAKRRMPSRPEASPPASWLVVLYSLTAIGLYFAWRRVGPVALVPLVFAAGYILPMVPMWFYRARFGAPISWVSLVYVAGAVLLFGGADVVARRHAGEVESKADDADVALIEKVADNRSRAVLAGAGVSAGAEMVEEAGRLLNRDEPSERLLVGVVAFPMTVRPGDEPLPLIFGRGSLLPGDETLGAFHLVSPWKRGGSFRISHVALGGGLTDGIRPGEQVLVVRERDSVDSIGELGVVGVRAAAVLPTRWAG